MTWLKHPHSHDELIRSYNIAFCDATNVYRDSASSMVQEASPARRILFLDPLYKTDNGMIKKSGLDRISWDWDHIDRVVEKEDAI